MKKTISGVISFLLPLVLALLTEWIYPTGGYLKLKCFLLTCCLFYTFYFFVMGLTKKSKIANTVLTLFVVIISISTYVKLAFMNEPLYLSDILYIGDAGEIKDLVKGSIFVTLRPVLLKIFLQILILIGSIIIGNKTNITLEKKTIRIPLVIGTLALLVLMFIPNNAKDRFMLNNFFDLNNRNDYACITSNRKYYGTYGSITGMYGILLENRNIEPEDYDETKIKDAIKNVSEEPNKTLGKPNIIVIFSESFWDLDQLDEVEYDRPLTSNFNRLKKEGLFFNMISPSYGGISANVEFEFLTGATLTYFAPGYIPYMQLYTNRSFANRPSIITELNNADYTTKIVQSGGPKQFNCAHFYEYVKMDSTDYMNEKGLEHKKGQYMADSYVTDLAIQELQNKKENEKLFYMIATMQAHMPYLGKKYEEYDISLKENSFSKKTNQVLLNYGQGIYDADKELGRLYDYIKTYKEPTILIFYGDHLPYLNNGKEDVLSKMNYFNTGDEKTDLYRKYNTQALVLANFNIKPLKDTQPRFVSPDLLSTYVLNHMDIKISNYYKWLYGTINTIGGSNQFIITDQQGNLYYNNELNKDQLNLYNLRKNIQYKYFIEG